MCVAKGCSFAAQSFSPCVTLTSKCLYQTHTPLKVFIVCTETRKTGREDQGGLQRTESTQTEGKSTEGEIGKKTKKILTCRVVEHVAPTRGC